MGNAVKLDEIMRMRDAMKLKLTPRFREWWDAQIEQAKEKQGGSRKDKNKSATLAETIGTGRKEVSHPLLYAPAIINLTTTVTAVTVIVYFWFDIYML